MAYKLILVLLLMLSSILPAESRERMEINQLRKQIIGLSTAYQNNLNNSEVRNRREMARYQANLLIKVMSYEIYIKLKKNGTKRRLYDIQQIVTAAWLNSWVFVDLGKTHLDRFELILQWANDESGYNKDLVSKWKAGTYLSSINKTVLKDSTDYGIWQINDGHRDNIKILNYLYESGMINFKIKRIKRLWDVMDINTNCAARCLIETDRKSRGWEWQHVKDQKNYVFLKSIVSKLETEGLYDRNFVQQYYYSSPIKTYSVEPK